LTTVSATTEIINKTYETMASLADITMTQDSDDVYIRTLGLPAKII